MKTQKNAIGRYINGKIKYKVAQILWENDDYAINVLHQGTGAISDGRLAVIHKNTGYRYINGSFAQYTLLKRIALRISRRFKNTSEIKTIREFKRFRTLQPGELAYQEKLRNKYQHLLDNMGDIWQ